MPPDRDIKIEGSPEVIDDKGLLYYAYDVFFKNIRRIKRGKKVKPLIIVKSSDKAITLPIGYSNNFEKIAFSNTVLTYCLSVKARYVLFINDCYYTEHSLGTDVLKHIEEPGFVRPMYHPDRKEGLILSVVDPVCRQDSLMIKYDRIGKGVIFENKATWSTNQGYLEGLIKPWGEFHGDRNM